VAPGETAIVDSTAHALKFSGFQDMYFQNSFPDGFAVRPNPALVNEPRYVHPKHLKQVPAPGKPLDPEAFSTFVKAVSEQIAADLGLKKRT
jgi:threonine synthase